VCSVIQALGASSFSGKPTVFNLEKSCPSVRDVELSFGKLQELCLLDSVKEWHSDVKWLCNLESTQWLTHVRSCLQISLDVVKVLIDKQDSVLIEESDGRDLTCVVASLVQLLADCHYRSLKGLQALIQKEWIVTGHRFMTRYES
jgi:myotubularin-related protein 10/11/12